MLQLRYAVSMTFSAPSDNVSNVPSLHRHKSDILKVAIFLSYKACDRSIRHVHDGEQRRKLRHAAGKNNDPNRRENGTVASS